MVQMSPGDQAVVKALPGNSVCCDCEIKNPQWASVPFGNVFCLECSGVHRSLGVHISFVRSIAMDSWTDQQLAMMKNGGNDKLNTYLAQRGIDRRTPIKQKYESDAAQLYKLVLKARIEGKPEPTVLPKPVPKAPGSGSIKVPDPNGLERLPGETDQQYIARQSRLRDEAKARMASKFGGSSMGGVGSGGRSMQGIGSDPGYDPNRSAASSSFDVSSLASGLGSAIGSAGALASSVTSSVLSQQSVDAVKSTGASFWGSLTAGVSTVAASVTSVALDNENDGLADLQRQVASQKPMQSKYAGFGSESVTRSMPSSLPTNNTMSTGGVLQEAQGLPGEDRNGIARLTGETDEQYVMRQTRLRDEARARMAAKFGGQSMSSASSTDFFGAPTPAVNGPSAATTPSASASLQEAPGLPGEDRNGIARLTGESEEQYVLRQTRLREEARARMAAKFGGSKMSGVSSNSGLPSAPSSLGGSVKSNNGVASAPPSFGVKRTTSSDKSINSDDFFSSFGT